MYVVTADESLEHTIARQFAVWNEQRNHQIHFFSDPKEAEDAIRDPLVKPPDLLVVDCHRDAMRVSGKRLQKRVEALGLDEPGLFFPTVLIGEQSDQLDEELSSRTGFISYHEARQCLTTTFEEHIARPDIAVIGCNGSVGSELTRLLSQDVRLRKVYACGKLNDEATEEERQKSIDDAVILYKRITDAARIRWLPLPNVYVPRSFEEVSRADIAVICVKGDYNTKEAIVRHGHLVREHFFSRERSRVASIARTLQHAGYRGLTIVTTNPVEHLVSLCAAAGLSHTKILGVTSDTVRAESIIRALKRYDPALQNHHYTFASVVGAHHAGNCIVDYDNCGFVTLDGAVAPFKETKMNTPEMRRFISKRLQAYAFDRVTDDGVTTPYETVEMIRTLIDHIRLGSSYRKMRRYRVAPSYAIPPLSFVCRNMVSGHTGSVLVPVEFRDEGFSPVPQRVSESCYGNPHSSGEKDFPTLCEVAEHYAEIDARILSQYLDEHD